MKRIISIGLIVGLLLSIFSACSTEETSTDVEQTTKKTTTTNSQTTPKETKEKNETSAKKESVTEQETTKKETTASQVDMHDMNALYNFVNENIQEISRKSFDTWETYYFDITQDGKEEVVFVSTYGADWYEKMEIITGDNGEYKRIPSDIPLAKSKNVPFYENGFFTVLSAFGGTGEFFNYMDLYVYDGTKIINVLADLVVMHEVQARDVSFKETGRIEGDLKDFAYTLTKYDNLEEKETVQKSEHYVYDEDNMKFEVETVKIDGKNSFKLSELKNGEDLGYGLTINNINFSDGNDTAEFTLQGYTVLTGELYYDLMTESILFKADRDSFPITITVEGPKDDVFDYKPEYLGFTNASKLYGDIGESSLGKINDGEKLGLKIKVEDIDAAMNFGSDVGSRGTYVEIIDSWFKE